MHARRSSLIAWSCFSAVLFGAADPTGAAAADEVGAIARRMERSVLILGDESVGHGTGWVVSQKGRLVATNAHVADLMHRNGGKLFAIVNGSKKRLVVERAWYHPGLLRILRGTLLVRSEAPADGVCYYRSPDVAVVRIKDDGEPLAPAFALATPADLDDLFGQRVGMLGFPGSDTKKFPAEGETAQATIHSGAVSRITGFFGETGLARGRQQFLQHTAQDWGGFSGSALFLPNGRVVGLHNSYRRENDRGLLVNFAHGIRVDCLWELLVHHGLADEVGLTDAQRKVDLARFRTPPSEDEKKLREAIVLVEQAKSLLDAERYAEGLEKCSRAIELSPNFPDAHLYRSGLAIYLLDENWRKWAAKDRIARLRAAAKDADAYVKLAPGEPYGPLCQAALFNRLAEVTEEPKHARTAKEMLAVLRKMFESPAADRKWLARTLMELAYAHLLLGERESAIMNSAAAIKAAPDWHEPYLARAELWDELGDKASATRDRAAAAAIRKKNRK